MRHCVFASMLSDFWCGNAMKMHHLLNIIEKPIRQYHVSAGIYILSLLFKNADSDTYCDMPDLSLVSTSISHCNLSIRNIVRYRMKDLEKSAS